MSKFLSAKYKSLLPYKPGEQPKDIQYLKLNTNESPFPPCSNVVMAAEKAARELQLYPDPDCRALVEKLSERLGVSENEIILTNGSDDILNFAFMAFCDDSHMAIFPDITYGFYSVFADINNVPYKEIPLRDNFKIEIKDYICANQTIFIANPNAPTGIALAVSEIEEIVKSNPNNVIVIDEAYVDFGAKSCIPLIHKYDNLLVTQTFSKSRSLAGARLGFGVGCAPLIKDLKAIKNSTNPYSVNSMTIAAGIASLNNDDYTKNNCRRIIENRDYTMNELKKLGFTMTNSHGNFVFAKSDLIDGKELYLELKKRGILVRHFDKEKIGEYNRITVGSMEQMKRLIFVIKEILEGR